MAPNSYLFPKPKLQVLLLFVSGRVYVASIDLLSGTYSARWELNLCALGNEKRNLAVDLFMGDLYICSAVEIVIDIIKMSYTKAR